MNKVHQSKVAGACVTGLSHLKKDIPCQDRIFSSYSNGVTAIALADGAGSYKKPEVGAEIVTKYVCEYITKNFSRLYNKQNKDIAKELLIGMRENLIDKAKSLKVDIKELSSTILFVGADQKRYLAGHIGDGMIGYYEKNKARPLSQPDNDNGYTIFPASKGAFERFRIYKNSINNIDGFILMSDGSFDSLYNPNSKKMADANVTMFEWLQNDEYSKKKVESEIHKTIRKLFLENSVNGDDCSVNILAITDEKVLTTEIREIDMKQVNDNTIRIKKLNESIDSFKIQLDNFGKQLSEKLDINDLLDKLKSNVDIEDFNNLKSQANKSESQNKKRDKRADKLDSDLSSIKAEISQIKGSLNDASEEILDTDINDFLKWRKQINILVIILFLMVVGLFIKFVL